MMTFGGCTVYMTPSTTSDVDSYFEPTSEGARDCRTHSSWRFFTFAGVIPVSGLCRWPLRLPEYVSQFCGSAFAFKSRSNVTCAPLSRAPHKTPDKTTAAAIRNRACSILIGDHPSRLVRRRRRVPPEVRQARRGHHHLHRHDRQAHLHQQAAVSSWCQG